MTPGPPDPRAGLARLMRLARKELSESLRDRRTVLTLVLMPALLYPILALALQQLVLSSRAAKAAPRYQVAVASAEEGQVLAGIWKRGQDSRVARHGATAGPGAPPKLSPYLDPMPDLSVVLAEDPTEVVRQGAVDVAVRLGPPAPLRKGAPRDVACTVYYREGSSAGREAARYIEELTTEDNVLRLRRLVRVPLNVARLTAIEVPDDRPKKSPLVPVLVPLLLVLMTMTGAVYPAIDLTAGERERGTLEVLVAAPIPRLSVLLAKYVAVVTVAMLTALVNLGMMALVLSVLGLGRALFQDSFTLLVLAQLLGLLLLFAAFSSAVLLTVTSFARSFKEAQAYLIPLILVALLPGMMALLPGLRLEGPLAVVPMVNIVLLARDILGGGASPGAAAVVVVVTLLYSLGAVALASRIFGTEAVLSSEQSGWSDLLRRPPRPAPRLAASSAVLCLVVLFPLYFLTSAGLARAAGLPLEARLGITAAAQVVLFAGLPAAAAWLARVEPVGGFRLQAPRAEAWPVALVLGASLWPLIHQVVVLLGRAGLGTMPPELLERVRGALEAWREVSPVFLVAVLALLPAVLEELFFRGLLLESLAGEDRRAVPAVVGSAALFALFHLLVTDALAVERLPPSLLMGLVLGWLTWRSGSVWPGMLLHALHNSAVVLIGYYEPSLDENWLLAAGAAGTVLGLAALGWGVRRKA